MSRSAQAMRWTADQLLGITLGGQSLLVSAAAGSGKTSVLTQRVVHLICDADPRCDVDELLVVTFTEQAAEEMRRRITQSLRAREAQGTDARLTRQLALIDNANVSTLHAFCARLLRQNCHLVGLDPAFSVMDGDEARLLRLESAQELFERRYDDEDGRFARLIDDYGQGDDQRVMAQMLHIHDLLSSVVDPTAWIDHARRRVAECGAAPFNSSELGGEILKLLTGVLHSIKMRCATAIRTIRQLGIDRYAVYLEEVHATLDDWTSALEAGGVDALARRVAGAEWGKRAPVKNEQPGKEAAAALVDSVMDDLKKGTWLSTLRFTSEEWRDSAARILPHTHMLLELVQQFSADYARAKRELRSVDFSDLERLTLRMLHEGDAAQRRPSPAAHALHRRFAHVLVDEFQDINELQEAILTLVSRECLGDRAQATNLFCVGDVKQSIYRFRLAEPKRFLDRQLAFRQTGSHGRAIDLRENFRSRWPLLEAVNAVFSRLMTRDAVDIEYDQSHRLVGRMEYPDAEDASSFAGAPIELHLLPEPPRADAAPDPTPGRGGGGDGGDEDCEDEDANDLTRTECEAVFVARRIRDLLGMDGSAAMRVSGDDASGMALRKARFGDIAILLRSMKFKAEQFAEVLRQHGIPVHAQSNSGYFASMEVRDMVALLSLLDNQRQDVPLAATLRSPLGRLTNAEDGFVRIRLAYPAPTPFHEAAIQYAAERTDDLAGELRSFFARLDGWRRAAQRQPLADVIWSIYSQSSFLCYVAGLDKGEQRVRNLLYLHERAAQFGKFQSRGLSRFMRFIDQLREDSDVGQPSTASRAEDVVRIMSIHASKGLEFPIVIVPDLGKAMNLSDCRGWILADRQAGLGMDVVDEERRCRYPSIASTLVRARLRQQTLAEEMRVLYVAMTRAREHLILAGTVRPKTSAAWESRWRGFTGPMPTDAILGARTMLDWLGPTEVMTRREANPPLHPNLHSPDDVASWTLPAQIKAPPTALRELTKNLRKLTETPTIEEATRKFIEQLSYRNPHERFARTGASQAVTHGGHPPAGAAVPTPEEDDLEAAPLFAAVPHRRLTNPKFLEKAARTGADRGTATHLFLQHLDFKQSCDAVNLAAQNASMVERSLITPEQAAIIDLPGVQWLLADPVGRLLRQETHTVHRELPLNFPRAVEGTEADAAIDPLDRVMIRGRMDVLIVAPDGVGLLLDFKTDRILRAAVPRQAEKYRPQLEAYRQAFARITGLKIREAHLAFLWPKVMHRL